MAHAELLQVLQFTICDVLWKYFPPPTHSPYVNIVIIAGVYVLV